MDHWGPKHVEPSSVTNKLNHKTSCIWLVYIYIDVYNLAEIQDKIYVT